MKVVVYPADRFGCGHFRLIWPAKLLNAQGHDVTVVTTQERRVRMMLDVDDRLVDVDVPDDVDVIVLQRPTHRYLADAVSIMRTKGIAVVVDIDDDLSAIHPANPAWTSLHPHHVNERTTTKDQQHSWNNAARACRDATLVTTTTPSLVTRYARHGRARVLPNYLPDHYFDVDHIDSDVIGWPASLSSHPNDPAVVGNAVARLVADGYRFRVTSGSDGIRNAFGVADNVGTVEITGNVDLADWPAAISTIGVGIAPLADTQFNHAKSWLKPLELSAVGVPWVASPRAEYTRLHRLGCGVLVDKPKHWHSALRVLLADADRRAELANAGRAVAASLRLRDHAWRWLEAWSDALTLERTTGVDRLAVART